MRGVADVARRMQKYLTQGDGMKTYGVQLRIDGGYGRAQDSWGGEYADRESQPHVKIRAMIQIMSGYRPPPPPRRVDDAVVGIGLCSQVMFATDEETVRPVECPRR